MQTAANSSLLLTDLSSLRKLAVVWAANEQGKFYQQIVKALTRSSYRKESQYRLGERLVGITHHAYMIRRMDKVDEIINLLLALPLPYRYQNMGKYYQALSLKRQGKFAEASAIVDRIKYDVPQPYQGRIVMSQAAIAFDSGDLNSALSLYVEASRKASSDMFTYSEAQRQIAVLKGIHGDHNGAASYLESLYPFVRAAAKQYPSVWYGYLNSLALELSDTGRIREAENVCRIVLASPLVGAYPEWRETWDEIQLKAYSSPRSVVSFARKSTATILQLPERETSPDVARPWIQSARVLNLLDWKNKMVKEPNGENPQTNSLKI